MNDNKRKLYDALSQDYDLGTFEQFESDIADAGKRRKLYDATIEEYDFGDFSEFENQLGFAPQAQSALQLGADKSAYTFTAEELGMPENTYRSVSTSVAKSPEIKPLGVPRVSMGAEEDANVQPHTTFGEGVKQGADAIYQGNKYFAGEQARFWNGAQQDAKKALEFLDAQGEDFDAKGWDVRKAMDEAAQKQWEKDYEEFIKVKEARRKERKEGNMGLWERILHKVADPSMPEPLESRRINPTNMSYQRPLLTLNDALKEADGDVAKARAILEKKASEEQWADKTMREASEAMAKHKPVEGAAWWGQLVPQVAGQAAAIGANFIPGVGGVLGKVLSYGTTAGLTASSAGQAMAEARQAGASDEEVWSAGVAQAVIEAGSEQIPLNRLIGKTGSAAFKKGYKAVADNIPEKELEKLLVEGNKRLGGKLLSGKTAKELIKDMGVEGASEFVAEFLGTYVPIIYADKESYPTLLEAVKNGWEGAKAGFAMGGFLGGGSTALSNTLNENRRKKQGFVELANDKDGNVVEVIGEKEGLVTVLTQDGTTNDYTPEELSNIGTFSYDEWKNAKVDVESRYIEGYKQEPTAENAVKEANEYTNARNEVVKVLSLAEGVDVDAMLEGRTAEEIAMGDSEIEDAVNNYIKARARRDGFRERYQEERDRQFAESDRSVDETANDGMVYTTTTPSGEKIIITGGKVVLDNEGYIDVNQSEGLVAMFPDSQKKPVRPGDLREKVEVSNAEETKAARRASIEEQWRAEFESAENAYVEQQKRAEGVVFDVADQEGTHRVEVVKEGDEMSNVLVDGEAKQIPTEMLNALRGEAGVTQAENRTVEGENEVQPEVSPGEEAQPTMELTPAQTELPKEKQAVASIPTEKRGKEERAAYHMVPIERTMEDLHDGTLEPDEIVGLIDARIKEAENDVKSVEKKKPVIGVDKNAYVTAKQQWQADMEAAKAKLDYYNKLKAVNEEATRSEMREAVEGVQPQVLIEQNADEFVANQLGDFVKITPEGFQKETGLKAEQKQMVGVIAGKEKGGVTIEQAAEIILENYGDELRDLGFNGDMQDMRDMIIDILSNGNPRSYARKGAEMRAQESVEEQLSQFESIAIGMNFADTQEMIEFEEAVAPKIIQDYTGFDEQEYFNNLAENYEYDTTREGEGTRGGSELLQSEQTADNAGVGDITEPGQGGEVQGDVYSGGENAASQGNQQQVSSPEIPSTGEVVSPVEANAEGGNAPGQSGVSASLVKGTKWEKTGEPDKVKYSRKRGDSHDITWYIGKKKYGSTTAERDLLVILAEDYGGDLNAVWNAYEQGEVLLSANEAAILKKLIETNTSVAELQQGTLELDRENPAFERATKATMDAVERLKANGLDIEVVSQEEADAMMELAEMQKRTAPETVSVQDEHLQTVVSSADKRKSPETALPEDESSFKGTAISSDDGAKILKDIDSAIAKYENSNDRSETFIGNVAKALGIDAKDKSSKYATFEAKNGVIFTIRISNHNATVSNFDNAGEGNGISIVISRKPNEGITNDGNAHLVEFFYPEKKISKADGKPLVEILKSIKQALYSGEYKDNTGLAVREEVNIPEMMTVFHGSGAKFDRFDHSFMGTGEGAQAFGWGTYVTEVDSIGRTYVGVGVTKLGPLQAKLGNIDSAISSLEKEVQKAEKDLTSDNETARHIAAYTLETASERRKALEEEKATIEEEIKPYRNLYTVEIPDDNGSNYLHWDKPINRRVIDRIIKSLPKGIDVKFWVPNYLANASNTEKALWWMNEYYKRKPRSGEAFYNLLGATLGSDKAASEFLSDLGFVGISYPANATTGGSADGARNYVIFNENDAKITNRVEFFEKNGKVYGWAVDGKIRLTPDGINPNTPVHEYAHLWGADVEKNNPKLWNEVVEAMKLSPVWNEVANDANYSNIHGNDSRMASEVLARLSGMENYLRTIEEAEKEIAAERDIVGKVQKKGILNRIKNALKNFWNWVQRNVFKRGERSNVKAESENASEVMPWEEFANSVIGDFYKGKNPNVKESTLERMFMGEKGAENLDKAEEASARLDNLNVAREMEAAGKDAKAIKLATGWERGADGKWRYETKDAKVNRAAKLYNLENYESYPIARSVEIGRVDDNSTIKLVDLVKDDELFKAYPEMEEYYVSFEKMDADTKGSHDFANKMIRINMDDIHSLESTLAHEIQHAIQSIEGFAKGGNKNMENPETVAHKEKNAKFLTERLDGEYRQRNALLRQRDELNKKMSAWYESHPDGVHDEEMDEYNRQYDELDTRIDELDGKIAFDEKWLDTVSGVNTKLGYSGYRRLAGEVESRNVQERMGMSPEERRNKLAEETEDVARKDQIFLEENLGVSAMGTHVDNRMAEVANHFKGKKLNEEQQKVVDVYSGNADNLTISVKTKDGNTRNVEMRQGNESGAGTKHSLYVHYGTTKGVINADDILLIPEVIAKGVRTENGKKAVYKLDVNGTKYTVVTYVKQNKEEFHNFYSNKKGQPSQSVNAEIGDTQSARITEELASEDKGSTSSAEMQEGETLFRKNVTEEEVIEQQEENEESIAKDAVTQLGEVLNAPVTIIDDLNSLPENRRNKKGWFDPKTGEVVVVIPNHVSSEDAVQTVLHEVVGHRGLRAVLGENFDEFLDDVFKNASPGVKRGISDKFFGALRKGHALTVREATEEYIAELAERGFEGYNGVWNSIKQWLKDAFRSLVGFEVTDNELRYLLWKSYNRQKSGPIEAILDIAMEAKTGTGNTMFRVVEDYNKGVQGVRNKAKEGWYDEMRSIKVAQEAIEKELGREVLDSENVYLYANHLPSINKNKKEVFDNKYLKPFTSLLKKLYELEVNGQKMDEKSVERYTNAKHGIERNREMSVKKALTEVQDGKKVFNEEAYAAWAQERDAVRERKLPWTEEQRELDKVAKKYGAKIRDYSGLTAIFDAEGKMKYAQIADAAYKYVEDVESAGGKDIKELWKLIKGMTDYSLKEAYESGMMSKSTYDHIKQMYRYYVPLRGFTEQTAEDFFDYVEGDHSPLNAVVKTAKGRTSEAENIFATILNMANSAIVQGSKNRLKQRLLNLAMRSRTGLLSVDNAWYAKVGDEYIPVEYPENADEYAAFEERMKELEKNGEVVRHRPGLEIGRKVADKWNQQQHAVRVKRNGREYVVWVNGDPRLANAVNGMLRENFDETWIGALNRWRAQMVTQYSPTFIFTNLVRDVQEASMTYAVRRGTKMMGNFDLNVAANSVKMMSLYLKHKKGTLNENIPVERYFKEFLENGGETGYTEMISIEQYEKQLKKLTEGLNMKNATGRAFEAVGEGVEFANRCIENLCRFSAYQTSREAGMSILKSIEDAKEVSVNFNRKGSGAMGQKWAKAFYMFLNPAIQSLAKRILLTKKFPKKMAAVWAGEFVMGATAPLLWSLIWSIFGDDEDKDELMGNYFNLTDYRRRSGLCLPGKDGVFHIPLSHEARALYGLGELFTSYVMGHEKYDNLHIQIFNTLSQSLPLNPLDGWAPGENILESMTYSLTPDAVKPIAEVIMNRDFAGNNVHNRSDFNEFLPEYMRGKRGTADIYKSISKVLSGKEIYGKGFFDNLVGTLVNPSTIEHLVEGYLGGAYSFADKAVKTGKWILGNEEYAEFKNVPIGSSFYTSLTKYEDKPREERTRRDWEDAFKFYQQEVKYYDDKETAAKNGEKNGEESGTLVLEQMERNGEVLMVDIFNDGNDRLKELYSASDVARRNREFDKVQEIDKQIYAEKRDIVERMEKLADDPMIGYTFKRNKIKGVYGELETYGDVRDANIINDFQTELQPIYEGLKKAEDRTAYANEHHKELGLYKRLDAIEQGVGNCKSAMNKIGEEYPDYAHNFMTKIRTLRAEAVELINKYRNE